MAEVAKHTLEKAHREVFDPFLGKNVLVSEDICDRLRGRYASGPTMANGEPEFGWREFQTPPIQHEAAALIAVLTTERDDAVTALKSLKAYLDGLRWGQAFPGRPHAAMDLADAVLAKATT